MFDEVLVLLIKYLEEYEFNAADMYIKFQWEHGYISDEQHGFCYWLKELKDKRNEISWDNLLISSIHLNIPVYRNNDLNNKIMIVIGTKKYYL